MFADLHTHSNASDGQYSPRELVTLAKQRGLDVLAITDHDTVNGLSEGMRTGEEQGIQIIPGVELGAKEYRSLHILGYNFSDTDPGLRTLCQKLVGGRDERKYRIIDFLKEKGIHIDLAEVEELAGGEVISRPHFAQVMVKRGYVASNREAFDRYLDTDEYQRIERFKADAQTCIQTIRAAGGKAALAHPYQLKLPDEELAALVKQLTGYGLEAIECHYPRHSEQQCCFYQQLAKENGLHISGGSDFHGEKVKPDIQLAALELELDWLLT